MSQQTLVRLKRVIGLVAREHRLAVRMPLPVWDSTGTLIGVAIEGDKKMGGVLCRATATFTLTPSEQMRDDLVTAKAEIAASAVKAEILVTIKPTAKAETAA